MLSEKKQSPKVMKCFSNSTAKDMGNRPVVTDRAGWERGVDGCGYHRATQRSLQ